MRIRFLLADATGTGGTVRTTLTTAGALAARGHDVEVVSVLPRRRGPRFAVPPGVRLVRLTAGARATRRHRLDPRRVAVVALRRRPSRLVDSSDTRYAKFSLATDVALWRYLRRQEDAVVVATRPGLNLAVARYAPRSALRVGQEHLNLHRRDARARQRLRQGYPGLDALVTLTRGDADSYRELLSGCRVEAVPNAVPDLDAAPRAAPGPDGARVVVAAGRLTVQKGFDLLVEAWREVAPDHPGWRLDVYGDGPQAAALQARIDGEGLADTVRLAGFTPDLPRRLAQASVFVLSSRYEGFPVVLLEAMAAGLPVVATDCPTGPADLVEDGVDGLLVPVGSPAAIAAGLDRLLADADLRRTLGANARRRAEQFAPDVVAARWEALFEDLARTRD